MDLGARGVTRERDQTLEGLRSLAAELRAHEQAVRGHIVSARRAAAERLYRRLHHINGMPRGAFERRVMGAGRSPTERQS